MALGMLRGQISRRPGREGKHPPDMSENDDAMLPGTPTAEKPRLAKPGPKKRFVPFSYMNDHTRLLKKIDAVEVWGPFQAAICSCCPFCPHELLP